MTKENRKAATLGGISVQLSGSEPPREEHSRAQGAGQRRQEGNQIPVVFCYQKAPKM